MKSIIDLMCLEATKGKSVSYKVMAIGDGNAIDQHVRTIIDDAFHKAACGVLYEGDDG